MTDPSASATPVTADVIATMIATVPFGLLVVGGNNKIAAANDDGAALFGLTTANAAGTSLVDLLADPAEALLLDELIREAKGGARTRRTFTFQAGNIVRALDLQCWLQPTDSGDVVLAMIEVPEAHDQTRQIRRLIANSPRGMARLVGNTMMTDLNDRWTEITGQSIFDATGEGWLQRVDEDGRSEFIEALKASMMHNKGLQLSLIHI